mgnify:CR=1 FL=1
MRKLRAGASLKTALGAERPRPQLAARIFEMRWLDGLRRERERPTRQNLTMRCNRQSAPNHLQHISMDNPLLFTPPSPPPLYRLSLFSLGPIP